MRRACARAGPGTHYCDSDGSPTSCVPFDWRRITCPVLSALVKNGDLVPDAAGMITKQQTFDALMHVGISRKVATETTDAHFDHLPSPKRLNVFFMNTVNNQGPADPPGALEHFRSTGIRDGGNNPQPNATSYAHFHECAQFDGRGDEFSLTGAEGPAAGVWGAAWAQHGEMRLVWHLMHPTTSVCLAPAPRRHTRLRDAYLGSRAALPDEVVVPPPGLRFSPRLDPE